MVVPAEKRAESVGNVAVGQDSEVIEQALEFFAASSTFEAAAERFHPDIRAEQFPLPSAGVVQGLEAAGIKFLLGGLFECGGGTATVIAWKELGVGVCELGHRKADVA